MGKRVLTVNPGSTSTRAVLFEDGQAVTPVELIHEKADLAPFARVLDQENFRFGAVWEALEKKASGAAPRLDAVVGRGGLLAPVPGGVYAINAAMLEDLRQTKYGEHACNLGAFLAVTFAERAGCPAYVVDPVTTDELIPEARITGLPEIERRSLFHALSQRGAARTVARRLGLDYEREGFVVAHLGGGVTVGAHDCGRVVDVTNALDGEGPFTPERSGRLPLAPVLDRLENGDWSVEGLRRIMQREAGLFALLGDNDLRVVEKRMDAGDERAARVFRSLAYNIAKDVGAMASVLHGPGRVNSLAAVVLAGGMARSGRLVRELEARLKFLAPVLAVSGLEEMEVMAEGAFRALSGRAAVKEYAP